jgi:hypothetical protein
MVTGRQVPFQLASPRGFASWSLCVPLLLHCHALGTEVDQTVVRKLAQLGYRTSYSHRGGFYTLDSIARFDAEELWGCRGAWFSRHGTLLATAQSLVGEAPAGYFAHELEARLHVSVKDPLHQLVNQRRLDRQLLGPLYLELVPAAMWAGGRRRCTRQENGHDSPKRFPCPKSVRYDSLAQTKP